MSRAERDNGVGVVEGQLVRNQYGAWELYELELGSGSPVEVLTGDTWMPGTIEHNGRDFVFFDPEVGVCVTLNDGIWARIRVTFH